jgi:splicing factor 3B subunit 1
MEEQKEAEKQKRSAQDDESGPANKKRRWDDGGATPMVGDDGGVTPLRGAHSEASAASTKGAWDDGDGGVTPGRWDAPTPSHPSMANRKNRWDETPTPGRLDPGATPAVGETPGKKVRSRWDETPMGAGSGATPMVGNFQTPLGAADMATPMTGQLPVGMTPEQINDWRFQKEVDERNRPWVDEELDALFPPEGYEILEPPASYKPLTTPSRKLLATPTPGGTPQYQIPGEKPKEAYQVPQTPAESGLPFVKPEDYQFFAPLLQVCRSVHIVMEVFVGGCQLSASVWFWTDADAMYVLMHVPSAHVCIHRLFILFTRQVFFSQMLDCRMQCACA